MASVGNSHRSASPRPTTLEEGRQIFVDFSLNLCLWFEIQGMRTYIFIDWVSNTGNGLLPGSANQLSETVLTFFECQIPSSPWWYYMMSWSVIYINDLSPMKSYDIHSRKISRNCSIYQSLCLEITLLEWQQHLPKANGLRHLNDIEGMGLWSPGPRLNIKTVFPRYGDSHVKDKTVGETVLSLTWESLYW